MIPMVFWASLRPCSKLKNAADTSCSLRKYTSIARGLDRRNIQWTAIIKP